MSYPVPVTVSHCARCYGANLLYMTQVGRRDLRATALLCAGSTSHRRQSHPDAAQYILLVLTICMGGRAIQTPLSQYISLVLAMGGGVIQTPLSTFHS